MQSIQDWFLRRTSFDSFVLLLPFIVFAQLVLAWIGLGIIDTFFNGGHTGNRDRLLLELRENGVFNFVINLVLFAPIIEELICRVLPFLVLYMLFRKSLIGRFSSLVLFVYILSTAAAFGVLHGDVTNLLLQGVGGILFAVIFLKMSNVGEDVLRGYMASALQHGAFNAVVVVIMLSG